MTSSSSQKDIILEKMKKIRMRKDLHMTVPKDGQCNAVGTHLAGMFFLLNYDYFRRLVEKHG